MVPRTWREAVALVKDRREALLHGNLRNGVHVVSFAPGAITMRMQPGLPADLPRQFQKVLESASEMPWRIRLSQEEGEPTLDEQGAEIIQFQRRTAQAHPLVKAILAVFPDAELGDVQDHALDEYGLPPEEPPELVFAPLDAELLDEDERPSDPGLSID
ncbi:hypothetical protein AD953_11360 [Acetobacter malorum]|uniref:DNA polymerase III subunit gamma/ tau C-terminal domain-containing protein n=1 Tax=Acetobacter malorum TaxID=178901 RepID=A0A149V2N3_9PROT|nr:hypothetical protein AD953_11360 [Acetobacter malorum]